MNPAALKANLPDMKPGTSIIVDSHDFSGRNLTKAGYAGNPLEDDSLTDYAVNVVDLTGMTVEAVKEFGLSRKDAARAKNMFALGLLSWMYGRPTETTIAFLEKRFAKAPDIRDANITAFKAGWNFGETTEAFAVQYEIKPAPMSAGTYRNITGNLALAYGLVAGRVQSGLPIFLGTYPITPASDILHELSKHKRFGITTFQAEDEIAGIGAALGASFAGPLGMTTTSGPGIALKSETIGLAVMTELPLLVIDVQRGGPSTGLPTKTEQADLLQAMFGRNGEAPVPIVAPQSPGDCFDAAVEAARIAVTYRTPVMLLSDGIPRQRLRALADPRRRRPAGDRPGLRDRDQPRDDRQGRRGVAGLLALPARRGDPRPAVGGPRHRRASSTASAAWRRATGTATSPTTPATTTTWSGPARPRSTGSPTRCRRWRSTTPPAARRCWCSAGARRTGPSAPPAAGSARPASTSPRRTCATSTRSPTTSARSSSSTTR